MHGDIAARNLILFEGRMKLIDFGAACRVNTPYDDHIAAIMTAPLELITADDPKKVKAKYSHDLCAFAYLLARMNPQFRLNSHAKGDIKKHHEHFKASFQGRHVFEWIDTKRATIDADIENLKTRTDLYNEFATRLVDIFALLSKDVKKKQFVPSPQKKTKPEQK